MKTIASFLVVVMVCPGTDLHAKTIVVLMDGTWNAPDLEKDDGTFPQGDSTNVEKFRYLLDVDDQSIGYFSGIGTDGKKPEKVKDGAFGTSAQEKVDEAYQWIVPNYRPGDDLAVFGFSRGAATARLLARKVRNEKVKGDLVTVRFLGLWDTVAALGVPVPELDSFTKQYHDAAERLRIPDNVKHVAHLVSIDEDRSLFAPTLISCDSPNTTINEVWFSGNHGDVGGGWKKTTPDERQLSDGTLEYMIRHAKSEPYHLKFKQGWEDKVTAPSNGGGKVHSVTRWEPTRFAGGEAVRELTSAGSPKPLVHRSAKEKYENDPTYRPSQLANGFSRFGIVD